MDKGIRVDQILAARERLRKAGIRACFFLQFGYPGEGLDDILETVRLVRETLPDDIGVSISYPLPGTKFHEMVRAELGEKDHWDDSGDLAMMFEGTYRVPLLPQAPQAPASRPGPPAPAPQGAGTPAATCWRNLDDLNGAWFELGRMEAEHRSARPTVIRKPYGPVAAPDLSRRWN